MTEPRQLDWTRQHVREGDPSTSIAAAESMPSVASQHCLIVLHVLREAGIPLSAEEVSDRCELDFPQTWRRMSDLKNAGRIVEYGPQARNRSRRMAKRYRIVRGG